MSKASRAARAPGIVSLSRNPTVFLNGASYTVVGIITIAQRVGDTADTIYLPASTALAGYGAPAASSPATMLITCVLGAADQVAGQLPKALRPDHPEYVTATPAQARLDLQHDIFGALNPVFLALAALMLIIGAVGIANTTLIAVLERTHEFGLRRALGARPRDITGQVLIEAIFIGTLGGLIGTALAVLTVTGTALILHWTAILDPWVTLAAPALGIITGTLAGLYPATRAAHITPINALRR